MRDAAMEPPRDGPAPSGPPRTPGWVKAIAALAVLALLVALVLHLAGGTPTH